MRRSSNGMPVSCERQESNSCSSRTSQPPSTGWMRARLEADHAWRALTGKCVSPRDRPTYNDAAVTWTAALPRLSSSLSEVREVAVSDAPGLHQLLSDEAVVEY